jgi:hypothetical protein
MKNKRIIKISIIVLLLNFSLKSNYKWGFQGHKTINRMAIFTLPNEVYGFFKNNIEFITENSTRPDSRRYSNKKEGAGHYIDLEYYRDLSNIEKVSWNKINKQIPEDTLYKHGILPWRIIQYKFLLQEAFEEKNYKNILKYASELGHYVADAHVPLHTTKNYNGQYTNQHGIHALWETKIVEIILNDINYFTEKAKYIDDLSVFIWKIINKSNSEISVVLNCESELTKSINFPKYQFKKNFEKISYSNEFIVEYNKKMKGLVSEKIRESISNLGSIWYTSWVDAGQPNLNQDKIRMLTFHISENKECK